MIKLYTDAATKGNPGPTGLGMLVVKDGQQQQLKAFLPRASNHQGEFAAAIEGFAYFFQSRDRAVLYRQPPSERRCGQRACASL